MTSTKPDATTTPPYPPWATFRGFFTTLKSTAIPPQIDSSVMSKMSGSAQQQVRAALAFFGLIDTAGNVQPAMKDLVHLSDDPIAWKVEWEQVFFPAYSQIINGLDIDIATLKQLADRFREHGGVSGSVLRKSLRFYLDALTATGCSFSPHFKTRGLSAIAGDRQIKRAAPAKGPAKSGAVSNSNAHQQSVMERAAVDPNTILVQLPGRGALAIPMPPDLSSEEWTFIDAHIKAYMALRDKKR